MYNDTAMRSITESLYQLYEKRYREAHSIQVHIYNRKREISKTRYYKTFRNLLMWCLDMGINSSDYLRVTIPWLEPGRRGPTYLNATRCRQEYLAYRMNKPLELCEHDAQTPVDLIRNDFVLSLELITQNQVLFGDDYELLMMMSASGLSPYFLATDATFVKLLQDGKLQGSYLIAVQHVLEQFAADTKFAEMVREIRNDKLRNVSTA